jgi:hypothetical protein
VRSSQAPLPYPTMDRHGTPHRSINDTSMTPPASQE